MNYSSFGCYNRRKVINQNRRAKALTDTPNMHTPSQPYFAYVFVERIAPVALPIELKIV